MPEQDGAVFGSPACGDDADADSSRRRGWRAAAAALVFFGLAVSRCVGRLGDGSATSADRPLSECRAEVELDPGFACALVGGCARTWLSDHEAAAVEIVCADAA